MIWLRFYAGVGFLLHFADGIMMTKIWQLINWGHCFGLLTLVIYYKNNSNRCVTFMRRKENLAHESKQTDDSFVINITHHFGTIAQIKLVHYTAD